MVKAGLIASTNLTDGQMELPHFSVYYSFRSDMIMKCWTAAIGVCVVL